MHELFSDFITILFMRFHALQRLSGYSFRHGHFTLVFSMLDEQELYELFIAQKF